MREREFDRSRTIDQTEAAGEAYRQASSSPARHLPRRSVCALTGDDFLIVPQTAFQMKGWLVIRILRHAWPMRRRCKPARATANWNSNPKPRDFP